MCTSLPHTAKSSSNASFNNAWGLFFCSAEVKTRPFSFPYLHGRSNYRETEVRSHGEAHTHRKALVYSNFTTRLQASTPHIIWWHRSSHQCSVKQHKAQNQYQSVYGGLRSPEPGRTQDTQRSEEVAVISPALSSHRASPTRACPEAPARWLSPFPKPLWCHTQVVQRFLPTHFPPL